MGCADASSCHKKVFEFLCNKASVGDAIVFIISEEIVTCTSAVWIMNVDFVVSDCNGIFKLDLLFQIFSRKNIESHKFSAFSHADCACNAYECCIFECT